MAIGTARADVAKFPNADVLTDIKALDIQYDAELRGRILAIKKIYLILCDYSFCRFQKTVTVHL